MTKSGIAKRGFAAPRIVDEQTLIRRAHARRSSYIAQAVSYGVTATILYMYSLAGIIGIDTALLYLGTGLGWVLICLFLSEIHFNDRFRDHFLTVPQSLGSITIQLGAVYLAPQIGFCFVCINFIILGFGALRMSVRQTSLVWTYVAVGLWYLFALTDKPIAMPMNTPLERSLALLCFVSALGRCAFTGSYGNSLREALYREAMILNELTPASKSSPRLTNSQAH